ncbi:MAG: hypothetical protein DRP63_07130 [Planctomycetota bacterium]|nr:MAG: hypothetical protein DRP63_07130 [Planctomycetota bacterium]
MLERGFTLVELMIVIVIIAVISAIAVSNLLGSRLAANEGAVVANLRTLVTVCEQYKTRFAVYPDSLATLGDTGAIDSLFASATDQTHLKQGYYYDYTGGEEKWRCYAHPGTWNISGGRHFYVDQIGVIRYCLEENWADEESTWLVVGQ